MALAVSVSSTALSPVASRVPAPALNPLKSAMSRACQRRSGSVATPSAKSTTPKACHGQSSAVEYEAQEGREWRNTRRDEAEGATGSLVRRVWMEWMAWMEWPLEWRQGDAVKGKAGVAEGE